MTGSESAAVVTPAIPIMATAIAAPSKVLDFIGSSSGPLL
jgi:hypothetical protein